LSGVVRTTAIGSNDRLYYYYYYYYTHIRTHAHTQRQTKH